MMITELRVLVPIRRDHLGLQVPKHSTLFMLMMMIRKKTYVRDAKGEVGQSQEISASMRPRSRKGK